jgi:hypothetical protein
MEYSEAGINTQSFLTIRTPVNSLSPNTRLHTKTFSTGSFLLTSSWVSLMKYLLKRHLNGGLIEALPADGGACGSIVG